MSEEGHGQQQNDAQGAQRRPRRTSIACPKCGGRKSRSNGYTNTDEKRVRRGRTCAECGVRFITVEIPADEYKRLQHSDARVAGVEAYRERLVAHEREREAKANELGEAFGRLMEMLRRDRAEVEEERKWQRENPTEALKAVLPAPVFEYLNDRARREGKSLMALLVERLTLDCEIDLDCGRGERPEHEIDRWQEKLMPHTVMYRSDEAPAPPAGQQ